MIKKRIVGLTVCLWFLIGTNVWAQAYSIPDTGDPNERVCYPQYYTDLGNGIVRDNVTGLEWQQASSPTRTTWQLAQGYITSLNAAEYLGYSDWRLPTIEELSTIVNAGRYNPAIDPIFNTILTSYWSSTDYAIDTGYVWEVDFTSGSVLYCSKKNNLYVRAVRSGQYGSFDDLVINGDGTVTYTDTGLMWPQCNYGQTWNGAECTGNVAKRTWAQALTYVQGLNTANYLGYGDWRLPTRNELQSIINYSLYNPATTLPNMVADVYWSSTTYARLTDMAWGVHCNLGWTPTYSKGSATYVRVVRSGTCRSFDGSCNDESDCHNALFCDGAEMCVAGECVAGSDPCDAGEFCDEDADQCAECLNDAQCGALYACVEGACELIPDTPPWSYEQIDPACGIETIWAASEADMYVGGTLLTGGACLYHNDGTGWESISLPGFLGVLDIWGSSGDDVYVVGMFKKYHFDGTSWSQIDSTAGMSVWGFFENNVFIGYTDIKRYQGTTWETMILPSVLPTNVVIRGLWGASASDMYAVGEQKTILHYNGNQDGEWTQVDTGLDESTTYDLYSLWGSSSDDIFAGGRAGASIIILHYDGMEWKKFDNIPSVNDAVTRLWGSGPDDVYAVAGLSGDILHYDGISWSIINSPAPVASQQAVSSAYELNAIAEISDFGGIKSVWGSSPESIYFAGDNGIVIHYTPDAEGCVTDSDCSEGYACVDGACVVDQPPVFLSEPLWVGPWMGLSSDPANPHKPQSKHILFWAYDDDRLACPGGAELSWMYRPVELQDGEVEALGDWVVKEPWRFLRFAWIETPGIADIVGSGLFEFKMTATDCLDQEIDSEGFWGKRYYFKVE